VAPNFQQAIVVFGGKFFGVNAFRQGDQALEASEGKFALQIIGIFPFVFAPMLAVDTQLIAVKVDLNFFGIQTRQSNIEVILFSLLSTQTSIGGIAARVLTPRSPVEGELLKIRLKI